MPVDLPPDWRDDTAVPADQQQWRSRLPRLAEALLQAWDLQQEGPPRTGSTAAVWPVRTADGRAGALKIGWPHRESSQEHLALRAWNGAGAVRLWRAEPTRGALLLERAGAADLTTEPSWEAGEVLGALYGLLHRPALPQLPRLSALTQDWVERLGRLRQHPLVPRRLVVQAQSTGADLIADPAVDAALLHFDLHDANVLAADQGGPDRRWFAIDPKPIAGDPHLEPAVLLWNRWPAMAAATSTRAALLNRLYPVIDTAGLDEDRVRAWALVRAMVNVLWALESAEHARRLDADWLTVNTVIAKAMAS